MVYAAGMLRAVQKCLNTDYLRLPPRSMGTIRRVRNEEFMNWVDFSHTNDGQSIDTDCCEFRLRPSPLLRHRPDGFTVSQVNDSLARCRD